LVDASGQCILKMAEISKAFPGVQALSKVSFDLKSGEVHVLLGENGAGKSTLIKILAGVFSADSGSIDINGKRVANYNPQIAYGMGVSVIYQELNLVPQMTVAENMFLGYEPRLKNSGLIDWKTIYAKAKEALDGIECQIDPRRLVGELSIAQQQMVEIAKAVLKNTQILVMDEPTSSLADNEVATLFRLIRKLRAQGTGIVYICHRMEEVFEVGDRATVLRDGKFIGTHQINEVTSDDLITMIVGRELTSQFPYETRPIGETILEVKDLNQKDTLYDIGFQLKAGEILAITGMLGAGRTELARAVFGASQADSGQIIINNVPVNIRSPKDAIAHGIGLLPEDRKNQGLSLIATVKENISLASLSRFVNKFILKAETEKNIVNDYIKHLKIKTPSYLAEAGSLSGGNQQKVVLAKWLCSQAKIVIFDEPTRGIDVGAKVEIYKLMLDLARSGGAIIMISSELPEVLGMSDRILVMREGRIVAEFDHCNATQEKIHAAEVSGKTDYAVS
jgi:ribose transport system ATP-binding protein